MSGNKAAIAVVVVIIIAVVAIVVIQQRAAAAAAAARQPSAGARIGQGIGALIGGIVDAATGSES